MCGDECWTDHRLIVSSVKLWVQPQRRPQKKDLTTISDPASTAKKAAFTNIRREVQNRIKKMQVRETRVWMGLKEKDDGWYWIDGSKLSLTFWAEGEPDGNGVPGFMGFHEDVTCASISRKFGHYTQLAKLDVSDWWKDDLAMQTDQSEKLDGDIRSMKWAVLIPVFLLSVLIGGTDIDGPEGMTMDPKRNWPGRHRGIGQGYIIHTGTIPAKETQRNRSGTRPGTGQGPAVETIRKLLGIGRYFYPVIGKRDAEKSDRDGPTLRTSMGRMH
ncbi:hypothetical protein Bbelb_039430 [Branchiostoma belcheri]|nr:hypothetical protein Bbelb_039430 [Branchiostoma belcheri]